MRILSFILFITFLHSCTTVEVAKEVTKASESFKTSVKNIINSIEKDKEILEVEKEEEKKLVMEQKKLIKINFLEKTLTSIQTTVGQKPNLSRMDGNTQIVRFDKNDCRLFLFFNSKDSFQNIKYYEIRDSKGNLIIKKDRVQNCYNDLNLS